MSIQVLTRLRSDHQNIKGLLHILRRQLDSIGRGDKPDYHLMYDIVHYLTYYPDRYHHPFEDLLFARLAELRPDLVSKVEESEQHHRQIARAGGRLRAMIGAIIDGLVVSRDKLSRTGSAYINGYVEHMQIEENELFDIVPGALKPADWLVLISAYHWQPDPVFSEEISREYRHLRECITAAGAGPWPWSEVMTSSCPVCSNA